MPGDNPYDDQVIIALTRPEGGPPPCPPLHPPFISAVDCSAPGTRELVEQVVASGGTINDALLAVINGAGGPPPPPGGGESTGGSDAQPMAGGCTCCWYPSWWIYRNARCPSHSY